MSRVLVAAALALISALGTASCKREQQLASPKARVVATISGRPLTMADVERAPRSADGVATPEAALERAIATRLAADEARRRGLDAARRDRPRSDDEAMEQALYDALRDAVEIDEAELRAEYERTAAGHVARQVVLRRREFASEADARGAGPLSADSAELIGPLPSESLPASVLPEALTLNVPGQRVVVARDGRFAVVELLEIRAAEPLSFELARPKLERSLRLQRAQEAYRGEIERLRREAEVEIDANALAERE